MKCVDPFVIDTATRGHRKYTFKGSIDRSAHSEDTIIVADFTVWHYFAGFPSKHEPERGVTVARVGRTVVGHFDPFQEGRPFSAKLVDSFN